MKRKIKQGQHKFFKTRVYEDVTNEISESQLEKEAESQLEQEAEELEESSEAVVQHYQRVWHGSSFFLPFRQPISSSSELTSIQLLKFLVRAYTSKRFVLEEQASERVWSLPADSCLN